MFSLSNRLAQFLPYLISEEQSGFVSGRSIHENINLAHELVADIDNKDFCANVIFKVAKPTPRPMIGLIGPSFLKETRRLLFIATRLSRPPICIC